MKLLRLIKFINISYIFKLISDFKVFLNFSVIIFILMPNLYAQETEFQFTNYTAEDGLSLSAVTKIIQDDKGFLWFGTYNGLNRYDG